MIFSQHDQQQLVVAVIYLLGWVPNFSLSPFFVVIFSVLGRINDVQDGVVGK